MTRLATPPGLHVVRNLVSPVTYRAADEGSDSLGVMIVRFSPFNTWYRIDSWWEGSFMERSVPGAFVRTFNAHNSAKNVDAHNIKTLFNHGSDFHIGDKLLGDILSAREENDGPLTEVDLWDTSYNRDLLPGLKRGAYGSSFMFTTIREEWNEDPGRSDHNPDGLPERTLLENRVFEAGPVTWPASPTASAGMRTASGTDAYYDNLSRRDPDRVTRMRNDLIALRSSGPANGSPTDPSQAHSRGLTAGARRRVLYGL